MNALWFNLMIPKCFICTINVSFFLSTTQPILYTCHKVWTVLWASTLKKKSHCKDADKILSFLAILQFSSSAYTVFKVIPDFSSTHLCVCSSDSWDPRPWLIMFLWYKVRKDYLALILVSCIARLLCFTQGLCASYLHAEPNYLCLAKT